MNNQEQWNFFEPQTYEIPKFLGENQINRVIENLKKSQVQDLQIELCFRSEHALKNFMQSYEQQMLEEESINYFEGDQPKQTNKFRRIDGFNSSGKYEVRQLSFGSFEYMKIFLKIYQNRLKQFETQYDYKLQQFGLYLRVYYPKNQTISSFFKNQLFEMKTKLHLYHCNEPQVIKKVQYSTYFSKLMQSSKIAANHRVMREGIKIATFYTNVLEKKGILQFINKNLLQHTSILNLFDKHLTTEVNRNIFKLIASFLSQTIRKIEREQDIIVEINFEKCCILVHDRHQCHTDAKNQILEEIGHMIFFRMQGKSMRSLFNKVIKNHKQYPYLRVKYSKRALFCVLSHPIFHSSKKHINSFDQLFKEFFENLNQENKLTFFLKNLNYPKFIPKILELTENNNLNVENFNILMLDEREPFSKVVLSVKALVGMASVVETRKLFYEFFLKIMLRQDFVENIVKNMRMTVDSFSNILGLSKPSTILPNDNHSIMSEFDFKREFQELKSQQEQENEESKDESQMETSISQGSQGYKQILNKRSYEKREKKPKQIELVYAFKEPIHDPDMKNLWELATRESKLQRALIKTHAETFAKSKFKAWVLAMREKIDVPSIQQLQQDKIFLSITLERQKKISHHFIDLEEFRKRERQSKMKNLFVFYKIKNQEVYVPAYVLQFLQ